MALNYQDAENIRHSLREFIAGQSLVPLAADAYSDDDSFMEKGILDSTGVLELVGHLEKNAGIRIEADEIVPDNLDSINMLVSFILNKRHL